MGFNFFLLKWIIILNNTIKVLLFGSWSDQIYYFSRSYIKMQTWALLKKKKKALQVFIYFKWQVQKYFLAKYCLNKKYVINIFLVTS